MPGPKSSATKREIYAYCDVFIDDTDDAGFTKIAANEVAREAFAHMCDLPLNWDFGGTVSGMPQGWKEIDVSLSAIIAAAHRLPEPEQVNNMTSVRWDINLLRLAIVLSESCRVILHKDQKFMRVENGAMTLH
jgi:hypothetical protein